MIGKKLPPPPPPLPSVPPPPTSQPPQPLHGSVGMALKSQSSRSPPVDFLPGTISSPEEMNTQVETTKPRVVSVCCDLFYFYYCTVILEIILYTIPKLWDTVDFKFFKVALWCYKKHDCELSIHNCSVQHTVHY